MGPQRNARKVLVQQCLALLAQLHIPAPAALRHGARAGIRMNPRRRTKTAIRRALGRDGRPMSGRQWTRWRKRTAMGTRGV